MAHRFRRHCLTGALLAVALGLSPDRHTAGQTGSPPDIETICRQVEEEMLAEINLLRSDPAGYAQRALAPLEESLERVPKDEDKPFQTFRVRFSDHPADYIDLQEGESEADSRRVLEEAIEALKAAPSAPQLTRNDVLDAAARFYSADWMTKHDDRAPHIDSLGRGPGERLLAFGATQKAIQQWNQFAQKLDSQRQAVVRVFEMNERFYFIEFVGRGGWRYWSVPNAFGEFVKEHGREIEIAGLGQTGFEVTVTVDVANRMLRVGSASIGYPLQRPVYGENVVWGTWSRKLAARGLVCWWILDPGIPSRGHRKNLLDADFRYCGIGCTWSRRTGWIATFDATSEPLLSWSEATGNDD